jgi:hypothetical protein
VSRLPTNVFGNEEDGKTKERLAGERMDLYCFLSVE